MADLLRYEDDVEMLLGRACLSVVVVAPYGCMNGKAAGETTAVSGNAVATSRQPYIWHGYLAGIMHSHDFALILNTQDARRFREYIVSAVVDPTGDVASENINRV